MSEQSYDALKTHCQNASLTILGGTPIAASDPVPFDQGTLLLLGPDEPAFWPVFKQSPEYQGGAADPMDRWSRRVITVLADDLHGHAVFPSDGPPYPPFFRWALDSHRCHQSPVQLLVHDAAGMFVSFRGVLALPYALDLPPPPPSPCARCADQPCRTSCPVNALTPEGYDVPACKAHIASPEGADCLEKGCVVRRSCPQSQKFGRLEEQSAFHMEAFLKP